LLFQILPTSPSIVLVLLKKHFKWTRVLIFKIIFYLNKSNKFIVKNQTILRKLWLFEISKLLVKFEKKNITIHVNWMQE